MSVSVPQPFRTTVHTAQPFRAKVEGVPTSFTIGISDLPSLDVSVEKIPVLHLSVDAIPPVHLSLDAIPPVHINIDTLPPIKVELAPLEIKLSEVPSTRVHIPADFAISLSLFGIDFGAVRLCGEAQVITEPYKPNACEICDRSAPDPVTVKPKDPTVVMPKDPIVVKPRDPIVGQPAKRGTTAPRQPD